MGEIDTMNRKDRRALNSIAKTGAKKPQGVGGPSLMGPAELKRSEETTHATIDLIQQIADKEGVAMALADSIGTMHGIAHVYKSLGMQQTFTDLVMKLAEYVRLGK